MRQHDLFRDYLDKVCEQIRWKKAHSVICRELGDHLEDEQAVLVEAGLEEDEAAGQAVLDMGDAALVGSQLDRVYRPRPAWGVIAVTAALMIIGYFARLYIIGHAHSLYVVDIPRSLFWMCAAIIVMVAGYFLDYTILGRHPLIIGAGFVILVLLIRCTRREDILGILPYNGYYYGAYLVVLIPVIYAGILWWWPYQGYSGLITAYLALIIMTMTILTFGVMFQALFCGAIGGLMLTAELLKGRFNVKKSRGLFILYGPVAAFVLWLLTNTPIISRISVLLNPELDPKGRGYMAFRFREILTNARWIGNGGHTMEHLPDLVNDFMLTFYIHQFGWIALVIVLVLFGALAAFSIVLMAKQKSRLGQMVSLAILLSLVVKGSGYIINNLGIVVCGFMTLPLLSYGNAALLIDSFLIGLMLSVFRNGDAVRDPIIAPRRIPRIKITMERLP